MTLKEQVQQQRASLQLLIQNFQSQCPHNLVAHDQGSRGYGTYYPQRICTECGLIEVGGWWCYAVDCSHWHEKDNYQTSLLGAKDGRTIFNANEKEFNSYRV